MKTKLNQIPSLMTASFLDGDAEQGHRLYDMIDYYDNNEKVRELADDILARFYN